MRTVAAAKINWTLEVLGRRKDGYHEIRSVMQTIDLCDDVSVEPAAELRLEVDGQAGDEDDLALVAVRAFAAASGRDLGATIRIRKRIPIASGLGGGSSDAGAVLRCLNRLHGVGLSEEELCSVAAMIGSDVTFFLTGGTGLAEGRGERVTALPDVAETWLVLLTHGETMAGKTKRTYGALSDGDFRDGSATGRLVEAIRESEVRGQRPEVGDQRSAIKGHQLRAGGGSVDVFENSFERAANDVFEGHADAVAALMTAGVGATWLAGAGPTVFGVAESEDEARGIAGRVREGMGVVHVARTLPRAEATVVRD